MAPEFPPSEPATTPAITAEQRKLYGETIDNDPILRQLIAERELEAKRDALRSAYTASSVEDFAPAEHEQVNEAIDSGTGPIAIEQCDVCTAPPSQTRVLCHHRRTPKIAAPTQFFDAPAKFQAPTADVQICIHCTPDTAGNHEGHCPLGNPDLLIRNSKPDGTIWDVATQTALVTPQQVERLVTALERYASASERMVEAVELVYSQKTKP